MILFCKEFLEYSSMEKLASSKTNMKLFKMLFVHPKTLLILNTKTQLYLFNSVSTKILQAQLNTSINFCIVVLLITYRETSIKRIKLLMKWLSGIKYRICCRIF